MSDLREQRAAAGPAGLQSYPPPVGPAPVQVAAEQPSPRAEAATYAYGAMVPSPQSQAVRHRVDQSLSDLARRTGTALKVLALTVLVGGGSAVALLLVNAIDAGETWYGDDMTGPFLVYSVIVALNTALGCALLTLGSVVAGYVAVRTRPQPEYTPA